MKPSERLRQRRSQLLELASRHRVSAVSVFGSASRMEDRDDSDIDLLVRMEPGATLFDLSLFGEEAETLLEAKVDIISDGHQRGATIDRIRSEAKPL